MLGIVVERPLANCVCRTVSRFGYKFMRQYNDYWDWYVEVCRPIIVAPNDFIVDNKVDDWKLDGEDESRTIGAQLRVEINHPYLLDVKPKQVIIL